ncbi:hypothetical protein T484DRAFT_2299260 [Baffinella frigidus]|nr:hypothetical protein T484DRAFT_2299260 [Cryptophyta sp. CCMP2293]
MWQDPEDDLMVQIQKGKGRALLQSLPAGAPLPEHQLMMLVEGRLPKDNLRPEVEEDPSEVDPAHPLWSQHFRRNHLAKMLHPFLTSSPRARDSPGFELGSAEGPPSSDSPRFERKDPLRIGRSRSGVIHEEEEQEEEGEEGDEGEDEHSWKDGRPEGLVGRLGSASSQAGETGTIPALAGLLAGCASGREARALPQRTWPERALDALFGPTRGSLT